MRIPIDDNTLGYLTQHSYSNGTILHNFNKVLGYKYEQDYEHITYGEWKSMFKTNKFCYEDNSNRKDLCELRELAKNFVFKIPNK